jgi:mannose/fructose/N-acetylgalactosamine-specific phosphotransferase system component IID
MAKEPIQITNKDLWIIWVRQWFLMGSINLERWQSLGYAWTFIPLFSKLYGKDSPKLKEALVANMQFFNTTPQMAPIIMGLHVALLEQGATHEEINSVKTALMGPFAGIGDPLWYATIRTVFESIAIGLAAQGSLLCVPMLVVPYLAVMAVFMWYTLVWSYRGGKSFIQRVSGEEFRRYMDYVGMVAVGVVGGLTALWVGGSTPLAIEISGVKVELQALLNSILPKMIPLLVVLTSFVLYRRRISMVKVLLIIAVSAFVLGALGIMGP